MTVTTPASPSEVQARLKAAVACLNLSLEAELTQYRCHRLVQSLSPFPAAAIPTVKSSQVISPADSSPTPTQSQLPPVAETPPVPEPVAAVLTTSVPTFKQITEPTLPGESPELAPESITELLAELEDRPRPAPQEAESEITPLQAWFAPIFPKEAPDPVTPAAITVEDLPPGPFPEPTEEDAFSAVPTLPKPSDSPQIPEPRPTSAETPVIEPSVDEVWFDLGDFQPFDSDILETAASAPIPEADDPELPARSPATPLSSPTVKQLDGPNTYFDSAAALLENIPQLDNPTPATSPSYLTRGLTIGLVLAGLVTTAGAMGYIWWQVRSEPTPVANQVDPMNPTPGLVDPDVLPPISPISPSPSAAVPSPVDQVLPTQASTTTTVPPSPAPAATSAPAPVTSRPTPAQGAARPAVEPIAAPMGEKSFFYVVAPYQAPQELSQARQGIANAYLVQFPEGVRIQFAAFEDALSAQTLVNRLAEQGIKAQVRPPQP
ncbi:hypothetical protein [Synechococcus sp. PCC 6312]|uniref:hypothetical protein n=1 Tax=Synechococcus sp. (strain ATCC 27167 / PCC 6312) TaxID=195253 RepID=UPI00029F226F|nr:hypothetical protein [Synechococcus sp. PCC 6312]AFY62337.1 hypothetical protein Syn6312_3295 [Synechococcus sp. PCC 6312]